MKTRRPLFYIALFFMLGIVVQQYFDVPLMGVVSIIVMLLLILLVHFWARRLVLKNVNTTISFLLVSFVIFSLGYMHAAYVDQWSYNYIGRLAPYVRGQSIELTGVIVSDPVVRSSGYGEKTAFTLDAKKYGGQSVSGKLLVNAFGRRELAFGDHIRIKGKMHRPFEYDDGGNFSYRDFLEQQQIYHILSVKKAQVITYLDTPSWSLQRMSFAWQKQLRQIIDQYLSEHEAGLIAAMILGDRSHIPGHIRLLFERTGTAHILAISGIHIGVIVFLLMLVVGMVPCPRLVKYGLVMVLLGGYVLMTGSRVSVIRASIMVSCLYMAFMMERDSDSLNALGLAALIILSINPMAVFHIGFQLSFISVLSILVMMPQADAWFVTWTGWSKRMMQSVWVSAAAWLGTLGVVAYYFGIITPVAILANIIIVPMMSMVVVLSFGLLATSIIPALAMSFALCLKVVLNTMAACAYALSHLPGAYVMLEMSWLVMAYYYVGLVIVVGAGYYFSDRFRLKVEP